MEEFLIDEFYEKMDGANFEAYGILGSDAGFTRWARIQRLSAGFLRC